MSGMLEGKVALVTGAASGVGRASALVMAREGAAVMLGDINEDGLRALVAEIEAAGDRAAAIRCDITREDDNLALVAAARERFGALNIAHLNAGGGGAKTGVLDANVAALEASMALNLRGTYLGMAAAAPAIIASGGGAIVVTSSQAGLIGQRGTLPYTVAKHGLIGMVRSAAAELAPHKARVNCVCPSMIYTNISGAAFRDIEHADAVIGSHNVLGRVGRPHEVGEVVAFLASDRASFMTAAAVPIEAGTTALHHPHFMDAIEALRPGGRFPGKDD